MPTALAWLFPPRPLRLCVWKEEEEDKEETGKDRKRENIV